MRFMMKIRIPIEKGNAALKDPHFGQKMGKLLAEIKAEAAYFSTLDGQRGAYIIVNMDDASQIPAISEPFFLWLNCDVEWEPVMLPQDLQRGGPGIEAAVKNWA
jgi:hypothetical protein